MLRRHCVQATPVAAVTAVQVRTFYNGPMVGEMAAHPDVYYGHQQPWYRGRGWVAHAKTMPVDSLHQQGGNNLQNFHDRQGRLQDPEDPRHHMVRVQFGDVKGSDGTNSTLMSAKFGPIPEHSRFLQVLYDNYREPFSFKRIATHLTGYSKVPCHNDQLLTQTADYIGETSDIVGQVAVSVGCTIGDGCTIRADHNPIYIAEGCTICDNVSIVSDNPQTSHFYQRGESFNPYQTVDLMEGLTRLSMNVVVESNCYIDSSYVGSFSKIGHNTKIFKGCHIDNLTYILPGSVMQVDTKTGMGELWGGAPAVKIGKINKWEFKKPYRTSQTVRQAYATAKGDLTRRGDQMIEWSNMQLDFDQNWVKWEPNISEEIKEKMTEFVIGREPFEHFMTRVMQGYSQPMRGEDKAGDAVAPWILWNMYRKHNDEYSETYDRYIGTPFAWKNFETDRKGSPTYTGLPFI